MTRTITNALACRLIAEHENSGGYPHDLSGYAPIEAVHVRHDDYQAYEQIIIRDPEGTLYGFEIVRNYGGGEGQDPEPSGHAAEVELTPMAARKITTFEYRTA